MKNVLCDQHDILNGNCAKRADRWFLMTDIGRGGVVLCLVGYCNDHASHMNDVELEFMQELTREEAEAWVVTHEVHDS